MLLESALSCIVLMRTQIQSHSSESQENHKYHMASLKLIDITNKSTKLYQNTTDYGNKYNILYKIYAECEKF